MALELLSRAGHTPCAHVTLGLCLHVGHIPVHMWHLSSCLSAGHTLLRTCGIWAPACGLGTPQHTRGAWAALGEP